VARPLRARSMSFRRLRRRSITDRLPLVRRVGMTIARGAIQASTRKPDILSVPTGLPISAAKESLLDPRQ
jgi:hypothetical protein